MEVPTQMPHSPPARRYKVHSCGNEAHEVVSVSDSTVIGCRIRIRIRIPSLLNQVKRTLL